MLVEKLFCSFFNPLISLYIYYDQYEKIWRNEQHNFFSRASFPWKWWPSLILGHSPLEVHRTLKPLLQMQ